MLQNALLKSYQIYAGGKKSKGTSKSAGNSNNNLALGKGLFIKAFCKCFFSSNTFYIIKKANRLVYSSLIVDITILGLQGELMPKTIKFYKYYNMPSLIHQGYITYY